MTGPNERGRSSTRWYQPLVAATQLCVPLAILLQLFDSHSVADFFSIQLLQKLALGVVGGTILLYGLLGIAALRRRMSSRTGH